MKNYGPKGIVEIVIEQLPSGKWVWKLFGGNRSCICASWVSYQHYKKCHDTMVHIIRPEERGIPVRVVKFEDYDQHTRKETPNVYKSSKPTRSDKSAIKSINYTLSSSI